MTSKAKWAFGSKLKVGELLVAELDGIGAPQLNREEIDVTSHDSVGAYEEVIMGIKRTGTIAVTGNLVAEDPGQTKLVELFESGELAAMSITLPERFAVWSFNAYVQAVNQGSYGINEKIAFNATLRVSGKPTLTYAGSGTGQAASTVFMVGDEIVSITGGEDDAYNVTLIFTAASTVASGSETATWADKTLIVALNDEAEYDVADIQALLQGANTGAPTGVTATEFAVSGPATAQDGTEWAGTVHLTGGAAAD